MVAAGAIAGKGAAPVERLENLDVLRKVKKLWGPMDDAIHAGARRPLPPFRSH